MNASDYAPGAPITDLGALLAWLRHEDVLCIRAHWADTAGGSGERWVLVKCRSYGSTPLMVAVWQMESGDLRQALRRVSPETEAAVEKARVTP